MSNEYMQSAALKSRSLTMHLRVKTCQSRSRKAIHKDHWTISTFQQIMHHIHTLPNADILLQLPVKRTNLCDLRFRKHVSCNATKHLRQSGRSCTYNRFLGWIVTTFLKITSSDGAPSNNTDGRADTYTPSSHPHDNANLHFRDKGKQKEQVSLDQTSSEQWGSQDSQDFEDPSLFAFIEDLAK